MVGAAMGGDKFGFTRSVRTGIAVLVVASTAAVAGVWRHPFHQPPEPPLGTVIIALDTTRADRLPVYGFTEAMPHLERLAREGVVFDRATSVAPLTLPAHCSLFTGLFPPAHGVRENNDPAALAGPDDSR